MTFGLVKNVLDAKELETEIWGQWCLWSQLYRIWETLLPSGKSLYIHSPVDNVSEETFANE